MSAEAHTKAAEDHKLTAKAHETAAQCHSKGDHATALENSTKAKSCCDTAQKSSAEALQPIYTVRELCWSLAA